MPRTDLAFFAKYRRKEIDVHNPDAVIIFDPTDLTNSYGDTSVRNSVSSTTDTFSGTVRYRPISGVSLRAGYTFEDVNRDHAEEWHLEDTTKRNIITLSGDVRVVKGLKVRAKYTHQEIDDPAYNVVPNRSDQGEFSISWIPLSKINTFFSYDIIKEERNDLHFVDTDVPEDRDVSKNRFLGSLTYLMLDNLSVTTSYLSWRNKIRQDIEYHDAVGTPMADFGVPYEDKADSYSFDVHYTPVDHLYLDAGVTRTLSRGDFQPRSQDLLEPVSVSLFSKLKIEETVYSLYGEYELKEGLLLGMDFQYTDLNDRIDNPNDDVEDGILRILMLRLSKKW
jgi:hypothetical protein